MKVLHTVLLPASLALGALSFTDFSSTSSGPAEAVHHFISEDGRLSATLVIDRAPENGGDASRHCRLFGAEIQDIEGRSLLGSLYSDLGSLQELPAVLTCDFQAGTMVLTPKVGDWALVEQSSDVLVTVAADKAAEPE